MSTICSVAEAAATPTGADLGPCLTHVSARPWPTGPGLPDDGVPLDLAELGGGGPRGVADPAGDPGGRLPGGPGDRLVTGGPAEPETVLFDGAGGEAPARYFLHDRPDPMDRRPLAPFLPTLVRFAAVTDELAGLRSQLAARADRCGTGAAAEATRRLLAVLEEGGDGGPAPFRGLAALVRPLALAAGPGTASGLALDLPVRLLDREFGQGRVVRFEEVDLPAALTHEPTRRFLCGTGLPEEGFLFRLDTDLPPRTLSEYYAEECPGGLPAGRLPARADRLIRLGHLVEDHSLVVDGATGAVRCWSGREAVLHALNTDISTLAFTLWLLHRERGLDEEPGHALTTEAYDRLAMTMIQVLSPAGPTGTAADAGRPH